MYINIMKYTVLSYSHSHIMTKVERPLTKHDYGDDVIRYYEHWYNCDTTQRTLD